MSAKVRAAIKRLERELDSSSGRTSSTEYAAYLDALATLIDYVKKGDKRV